MSAWGYLAVAVALVLLVNILLIAVLVVRSARESTADWYEDD